MSRRGENIRKRKDGRWEGRYIKGYDSKKQKARYASVYGKTYAETKQKLDEAKYKSSIGVVYVDAKNKLFGEIINSWFNAKKINLKPSSIIKYQNLIEKHILPELGHRKLRELNADLFYTFLDAQQKNGNKKNGGMLSTSSLQTMLYILNATIKYAASNNMVAYFSICLTRSGKEATPIQTLEQHEEDALDLFLSTHISRRNLGIMLSLYCGLRIGEVCALQWTDIDTKNAILYVRRTVQRIAHSSGKTKTKIHVGSPKSKSSIRVIPIPSFLVPIICTLAQEDPPDAYILTGSINKPLEPRTFQYYFDQVLTMAGIQKTNYHTLRHTFATNCVALGFDIKSLSEILGHSNVSIPKEDEGDAVMYILEKLDDDLKFLTQLGVECQMSISPTGSLVLKENEPSAKTHPRFELSFGSQDNEILFSFNECCYKYHPGLFKDAYLEFLSKEGADH